jgi:hypothetical protein
VLEDIAAHGSVEWCRARLRDAARGGVCEEITESGLNDRFEAFNQLCHGLRRPGHYGQEFASFIEYFGLNQLGSEQHL